jgi:hypothetical protein
VGSYAYLSHFRGMFPLSSLQSTSRRWELWKDTNSSFLLIDGSGPGNFLILWVCLWIDFLSYFQTFIHCVIVPINPIDASYLKWLYKMSKEKGSVFWEVIVSVIRYKNYICTCVLFRTVSETELTHVVARIKERQGALRRATRHVLTRAAKCIDVDGVIFENVLC